ncbi:hypothetical protein ACP70R_030273 [Stipagrostis hirtigluma subsp. patula]
MAAAKVHVLNNAGMADAAVTKSKGKWRLLRVVAVILCVLLYASCSSVPIPYGIRFFLPSSRQETTTSTSTSSVLEEDGGGALVLDNQVRSPCSSLRNHTICCDRSDDNTDVCFMAGDVRTDAASLSLLLFPPAAGATVEEERIRPYTRKWEGKVMGTIHEVRLRAAPPEKTTAEHRCDVRHDAPALVVTAGGYGSNYFHAFNDGFLPAWLTVQHLRRRVVLAVLSYNPRWAGRYGEIISGLSDYPVVDLLGDNRTHCFPGAIVGTRFHGYLAVDPARLRDNKTIVDFHRFLAGVYEQPPSHGSNGGTPERAQQQPRRLRPRLGIVSRKGTRVIENQAAVARLAGSVGFDVDILETPSPGKEGPPLPAVHALVRACDVLVGVHGSDLTSFLFLRPGRAALVQIAPLGVGDLSRGLFGAPAARMGLRYEQYDVRGRESSLSRVYGPSHVVVADPEKAKVKQGSSVAWDWDWDFIGRVYLDGQNVTLDLARFRETLTRMHSRWLEQEES